MKAMVLAAGRGARLRPLTDTTPKPLIQVAGKTLLDYHLEKLNAAGFTEVIINTCWQASQIEQHIEQSNYANLTFTISHEPVALETAGGVHKALPALGDQPFLLISADIWSNINYQKLKSIQLGDADAHLLMVENPTHNDKGDFSITDNRLTQATGNTVTYAGIGIFSCELFRNVAEPGVDTKAPLRKILNEAIDRKAIQGQLIDNAWFDVGTVERLASLEQFILNNSTSAHN